MGREGRFTEPLTDGFIAPVITLGDFRRITHTLDDDVELQVENIAGMAPVKAMKVQVTYAKANPDNKPKVVIA